ncbi:MAG: hypothetical protein FWC34_06665 [Bacteroidetes bacterium]|nr:hypothetical protein [Bacteroidota bacterium]MCL2301755.1 hypothetical protein [Lentimicrobiaceae bacterium]
MDNCCLKIRQIESAKIMRRRSEPPPNGGKYKVKYLSEAPVKTAQIYLDEPVYSEDVNIEKEKERILETYK